MNKQEAIKSIENEVVLGLTTYGDRQYNDGLKDALRYVEAIEVPEKPVVPQYVADMIVKRKKQGDNLVATLVNLGAFGDAQRWIRKGDNGDTFAKAWLFGYEVEKEKLYTAMLLLTGEYLRLDSEGSLGHFKVDRDYILGGARAYQFTKHTLIKYKVWENDNYLIDEVEE